MKKSDLKTGMRVETRNGRIWLVVVDFLINGIVDILLAGEHGGWMDGESYDDDLMLKRYPVKKIVSDYDIMKVYSICEDDCYHLDLLNLNIRHLIWKRDEYTSEQKEVFKALKVLGFKYIARDSDNNLNAYDSTLIKGENWWYSQDTNCQTCEFKSDTFDFIAWEDAEPFEIPELEGAK